MTSSTNQFVQSRYTAFGLCFAVTALLYSNALWMLFQFSMRSEQYSHILLIPIVSLTLLYQEREKIFRRTEPGWLPGSGLVLAGLIVYLLYWRVSGRLSENDGISMAICSAIIVWLGLFLIFFGEASFRAAVFPLCFLFLMVPIPEAALNGIISFLQHASADMTAALFRLTAIPVYRDGLIFALPGVTIEVAKECSGIRSSLSLFITSLLAGHLFLRRAWSKPLLYAAVIPITIFKNGLRIIFLSSYAVYVDKSILDSVAHRRGGIPFFGLALLTLGGVLWLLRKVEATVSSRQVKAHATS